MGQSPKTASSRGELASALTGRCLCAAVRYRCGPLLYPATWCHCEFCRRASGTSPVGWFTVTLASVEFHGAALRTHRSSPGVERAFCGVCGTPLTYWSERRPAEIDFTFGSLDEPDRVTPVDHIWMADAPGWDQPADGLPQHSGQRPAS
ncbi:MAG TPA: GFA family protein [Steroidobacteraceae bacterium]|nr:GFA family protein [Steroidobacteraceae bacterium]